jgi:hypothetical protein
MRKTHDFFFMVLAAILAAGCGGSSDHGNGRYATITGKIEKADGDPACDAKILLLPDTLNFAVDSLIDNKFEALTDSTGVFVIDSVPYGAYCVSGIDRWDRDKCVMKKLRIDREEIDIGALALAIPGTIQMDITCLGLDRGMVLYFPGLPVFYLVDSAKIQWINDVPEGVVELKGYNPATGNAVDLGVEYRAIKITGGETYFISYRLERPWLIIDSITAVRDFTGFTGVTYRFRVTAPKVTLPGENRFRFWWGIDDSISAWSMSFEAEFSWEQPGIYYVHSQIKNGSTSAAWSEPIIVTIGRKTEDG